MKEEMSADKRNGEQFSIVLKDVKSWKKELEEIKSE